MIFLKIHKTQNGRHIFDHINNDINYDWIKQYSKKADIFKQKYKKQTTKQRSNYLLSVEDTV